jgi:UV DNA damage repair endonuclease
MVQCVLVESQQHNKDTLFAHAAKLACGVQVVNERLSPNCKARLTVENDDRASLYSVVDLMRVHQATGDRGW